MPDFTKYAVKDKDGNPIEIKLPDDAIVGSSSSQTKFATILLKEKYPNWEKDINFTESQIDAIKKNKSSIGPPGRGNEKYAEKLIWHHDIETGKLILVPWDLNNAFKHTGGHKFWGQQKLD